MDYKMLITKTLNSLGANRLNSGYNYIVYGLILLFEDEQRIHNVVKSLYIDIAYYYKTNWNCVEKNIRHVVKSIWISSNNELLMRIFEKSASDQRPVNKEFFQKMYEYIYKVSDEHSVIPSELVCPITHQYCKAFSDYCMKGNRGQNEE